MPGKKIIAMSLKRFFLTLLPGILLLMVWQWWASRSDVRLFLFSTPLKTLSTAFAEIKNGDVLFDFILTASITVTGLLIGSTIGTMLGLTFWLSNKVSYIIRPYIIITGAIPIFALAPMLIMWFGTGFVAKVVMAGFPTVLISMTQAYEGTRAASTQLLNVGIAFRASRWQLLIKVVLPNAISWVMVGFRLNSGFALIGAFLGEFIVAERGLGRYILKAGGLYDIPRVLFGIGLLVLLSLLLNGAISLVEKVWLPWLKFNIRC